MTLSRLLLGLSSLVFVPALTDREGEEPRTGPRTEKRFPSLKLPPGFKATLFACDPFIEYPSVIAAGPKANTLLVAVDYMTGLGEEIVRRDEVRLLEDTDGDGYADKSTVVADGFNSIQGLAYHDGTTYVMHARTSRRSATRKDRCRRRKRKDLLTPASAPAGAEPQPAALPTALSSATTAGCISRWATTALMCEADRRRPPVFNGGGILRCRPDGRDLHVFSTGLRNIYDVALDAELNVFVRDNENDGGDYKIRVCHSFFGGGPRLPVYLYHERPDEALPPIADLGLGSSAGGVCYLERLFPAEFRGDLFFCEWGRSVVRYQPRPAGSGFAPVKEIEFAVAAENDPYGFKPTDLVVGRDGALFVSDWADGQRPKRGRGRIYRVTPTGMLKTIEKPATGLDSRSYYERCDTQLALEKQGDAGLKAVRGMLADGKLSPRGRSHALWIIAHLDGAKALDDLLAVAKLEPELSVRAQAVRVIADLTDPVLVKHKLDAGPGDAIIAAKLAAIGEGADARLQREVVIALGRLKWSGTPEWVAKHITKPDAALAHAAMQALRNAGNWPAIIRLFDRPTDDPVRSIALRAAAGQFDAPLVDGIIGRLKAETDPGRRRAYADTLTRVHRKPGPWVYWGYRPVHGREHRHGTARPKSPPRDRMLADPIARVSGRAKRMAEKVPARTGRTTRWLREERGDEAVGVILDERCSPVQRMAAKMSSTKGVQDRDPPPGARVVRRH